jgi:hypothetical protein
LEAEKEGDEKKIPGGSKVKLYRRWMRQSFAIMPHIMLSRS